MFPLATTKYTTRKIASWWSSDVSNFWSDIHRIRKARWRKEIGTIKKGDQWLDRANKKIYRFNAWFQLSSRVFVSQLLCKYNKISKDLQKLNLSSIKISTLVYYFFKSIYMTTLFLSHTVTKLPTLLFSSNATLRKKRISFIYIFRFQICSWDENVLFKFKSYPYPIKFTSLLPSPITACYRTLDQNRIRREIWLVFKIAFAGIGCCLLFLSSLLFLVNSYIIW